MLAVSPTMGGRALKRVAFGSDCSYSLIVEIEYDSTKDAANIAKHGVSLAWAARLEIKAVERDARRLYGEDRFNAFGLIEGVSYCLTFTMRGPIMRAISLRRARQKEYRRHVL
jgi:uncharacterized DUF497 family protein